MMRSLGQWIPSQIRSKRARYRGIVFILQELKPSEAALVDRWRDVQ